MYMYIYISEGFLLNTLTHMCNHILCGVHHTYGRVYVYSCMYVRTWFDTTCVCIVGRLELNVVVCAPCSMMCWAIPCYMVAM